jgi:hypothetical protein
MKRSLFLPLVFWGAAALAQTPGTFTATGNMTTPRTYHTATLLADGRVLIAGGVQHAFGGPAAASAELYDPSTRTFAATGSMTAARSGHTATLLPDGRVLIAGGSNQSASAELFDPSTGTFAATGNMTTAHAYLTATLLRNGRVLIAGAEPITELYDPATGTFTVTGGYAGKYENPVPNNATLLPDGRVLITGCDCRFDAVPLTEIYDPVTGTFGPAGTINGTVGWWVDINTSTLLMNGKVLVAGSDEYDWLADAEVYDPMSRAFTGIGYATATHEFSTATLLPDGTVLVAGSQLPGGSSNAAADLYVPATGTFVTAGNMTVGRFLHTATLLRDGSILIAGGYDSYPGSASSAELYKPPVLQPAAALLSLSGDGNGQGAILHAGTAQVVSADNRAVALEALEIYGTGLADGSVIPPQVSIGGLAAEVLFFGKAPGFAGLNQVNVRVPNGVAPGESVPVRLTYLGRPSNAVTIGVQ